MDDFFLLDFTLLVEKIFFRWKEASFQLYGPFLISVIKMKDFLKFFLKMKDVELLFFEINLVPGRVVSCYQFARNVRIQQRSGLRRAYLILFRNRFFVLRRDRRQRCGAKFEILRRHLRWHQVSVWSF